MSDTESVTAAPEEKLLEVERTNSTTSLEETS